MKAAQPAQPRSNALAQIHIAAAQLGLDDGCAKPRYDAKAKPQGPVCSCAYHAMLWGVGRVTSAAALDHVGRARVLAHLRASGFKPRGKSARPANFNLADRQDLMRKLEAQLLDAGRNWAYADGMAKRMFSVDKLAFCRPDQLHRVVAALEYDRKRRAARAAQAATPAAAEPAA